MPLEGLISTRLPIALATLALAVSMSPQAATAASQEPGAARPAVADAHAPVIVDGRVLFHVAGVSAAPATGRAERLAGRIRALADDPGTKPVALTIRDRGDRTEILAGETVVAIVYDADARLEAIERGPLAAAMAERIAEAIRSYRLERSAPYLKENGLLAVAATVLLVFGLYFLRRVLVALSGWVQRRYRARLAGVSVKGLELIKPEMLWASVERSVIAIWSLFAFVALLAYFALVLTRFPWTRRAGAGIPDLVLDPLRTIGLGIAEAVPGLVFILVLFLLLRYALKIGRLFFLGLSTGTVTVRGFAPEWAMPTYGLVRAAVIAFGVVVAFPYFPGSSSDAFKGVSIFVGVLVSLGSTSAIANTIAGYTLIYRRAFKVGDRVRIGAVTGDVIETKLQVTRLRTIKNEEVVVPNSSILNTEVVNFSSFAMGGGVILHTTVGIGYETPWRQVEAMLLLAASRTPGIMAQPAPFVHQKSLGDFCVTYELNVHCANPLGMAAVYSDLHRRILDVFNEYGVQIMTPAYESDPAEPKIVPKERLHAPPAQAQAAADAPGPGSRA